MDATTYGTWVDNDIKPEGQVVLLSGREFDILNMIIHGDSNMQIANNCGISDQTVKNYVMYLLNYFSVKNRTELSYIVQQGKMKIARSPFRRIRH
jgi:DNA-binding CsgD family transcriptional regulator